MAITLQLTDGTTTLTLSGGGSYGGCTYAPVPPAVSVLEDPDPQVSETAEVRIEGTETAIYAAWNAIEEMLALARRRQRTQAGARVYLQYKTHSGGTLYRSEVIDGSLPPASDPKLRQARWGTVMAALTITRRAWWEDAAERTLATGSLTNNGASRLALGTPDGEIPAPVRLEITNTNAAAIWSEQIFACVNAFAAVGTIDLTLPGGTINWSSALDMSQPYLEYDFSVAETQNLGGQRYWVLVGLDSATGNSYMRAALYNHIGAVKRVEAWSGEVYEGADAQIVALGPLPIPLTGQAGGATGVMLALNLRDVSASPSGQLVASWIQLMLAESFRRLKQVGFQANNGDVWVDDGMVGETYMLSGGVNRLAILEGYGGPLMVYPGRANELMVVMDESGGVNAARTMTATVIYRPRRLSV